MKIAIIGKGKMGAPLAKLSRAAGHNVTAIGSQDLAVPAAKDADLVILATTYVAAVDLAADQVFREALKDKIVVDITNPLSPDYMSLTLGHTTSAAEELDKALTGDRIAKAFNTTFSGLLERRAGGQAIGVPVFVAGEDVSAKKAVLDLARSFGFEAIDGGALTNARYLEPMAEFMTQLGYGLGHAGDIGFAFVRAG